MQGSFHIKYQLIMGSTINSLLRQIGIIAIKRDVKILSPNIAFHKIDV